MEGKYAEAEASLNAAMARRPSAEGFDLLGSLYEQQGKLNQAEAAYGQAVKLSPIRAYSKTRLGIVYGKQAKYAECIAVLEKLPKDIGQDPEALFYLCRSYLERGNKVRALETAARVEQLGEQDPGALLSVGRLLVSKDLYSEALPLLKKAINQLPKSSEAYYSLGFALFKMRKYDEMSIYLDQARNIDPAATKILLLQALGFLDSGKIPQAKEFIRQARTLTPDDKYAAYLWGRALIEEGAYTEAIKLISDLIAGGYNDPNVHLSLVTAFRKNGEFQKALDYSLKVAQGFPNNPAAQMRAGMELEFLGEFERAEEFLRKAIAQSGNDGETLTAARFSLARISAKQGKNPEAVQLFEDVIRSNPNDVYARVELADLQLRTGQYEQAAKVLQQALSFDDRNKRAHFLLGNVLTKLGRSAEAEQHFAKFQELEASEAATQGQKPTIYTQSIK